MRYRKKPVVIEAWQWLFSHGEPKSLEEETPPPPTWVTDALWLWPQIGGIYFEPDHPDGPRISIATLDAVAVASPGDWIIKGTAGELYPCKPDIFEATYEREPINPGAGGDSEEGSPWRGSPSRR